MRAFCSFVLVLATSVGLACSPPPPAAPANPAPPPPAPVAETVEPRPPPPTPTTDQSWDPARPIDPSDLLVQQMYVVVDETSVCPTQEQAAARDCGHSVEDVTRGLRAKRGMRVTVVAEPAQEGFLRALRFQKAGTLPGWVLASDVAEEPSTEPLDAWDALPQVAGAVNVSRMPAREVSALSRGTLVKWQRVRAPRFGAFQGEVTLYVEAELGGGFAIRLPGPSEQNEYVSRHDCLMSGECPLLDYSCDDAYCDRMSILARATGQVVPPPAVERWAYGETPIPLFEGLVIADRHGVFPEQAVRQAPTKE